MSEPVVRRHKGDGVFLFTEQVGAGQPVLLISGLGYSSWCWKEVRDRAARHHAVVTFDNRGTGRSDQPPGPYSIAMLADDAARVLADCQLASAHVVGHSMGGYIALTLALRHPALVRSLVLLCTSPGGPGAEAVPDSTQARWREGALLPPEENVRKTMPYTFSKGWVAEHPKAFEDVVRRRLEYPTSPECWLAQYEACVRYFAEGVPVEDIRMPSLVVHGSADLVVPVANGRLLARRLPNARYVELEGQGHLPYLEDPDGMTNLMLQHWRDAH